MSSPGLKSTKAEAYERARDIQKAAQAVVDRVAKFKRFRRYRLLDQPTEKRPRLVVLYTLEKNGLDGRYSSRIHEFDSYVTSVGAYLGSDYRKTWDRIILLISGHAKQNPKFEIGIFATTLEYELDQIREQPVLVETRPASIPMSDTELLKEFGIAPLDAIVEYDERRFLRSIKIDPSSKP
ncbi:MAG: hypothetical protein KW804_02475 [Candidatus Doudnabacteria bacterium]|nr:hypothetical protein [Candidatus Doudnabacteria bacterium]